jgi:NTP pyrophosphatase (non-canonical NTP hydrolase)
MDERIAYCIDAELGFARAKFPENKHKLAALVEEVGELAQALLHHDRGKATGAEVFAEAIQVAVMAIRIAEEGSAEFAYAFDHAHYQAFDVNKLRPAAAAAPGAR